MDASQCFTFARLVWFGTCFLVCMKDLSIPRIMVIILAARRQRLLDCFAALWHDLKRCITVVLKGDECGVSCAHEITSNMIESPKFPQSLHPVSRMLPAHSFEKATLNVCLMASCWCTESLPQWTLSVATSCDREVWWSWEGWRPTSSILKILLSVSITMLKMLKIP